MRADYIEQVRFNSRLFNELCKNPRRDRLGWIATFTLLEVPNQDLVVNAAQRLIRDVIVMLASQYRKHAVSYTHLTLPTKRIV